MAVFTPVTIEEARHWLGAYELDRLVAFEGIAAGIENSNFFVTTTRGRFVLTVFERLTAPQVPFYLDLMRHMARRQIPCPDPISNRSGALLGTLKGKPAALVSCLIGNDRIDPTATQCHEVGRLQAKMHLAGHDFRASQPNQRGLAWWHNAVPEVLPFLNAEQREILHRAYHEQTQFARSSDYAALPTGAVHADLFRDNVLFDNDRLTGVVDFYFAATDTWLFDFAVACNDWCIDQASGEFIPALIAAYIDGYRSIRQPVHAEVAAWPLMLRAAALRFWLSRLHDFHLPRPAAMVTAKDPTHFERILRSRLHSYVSLAT